MKACEQAASASRNSDDGAGRADRGRFISDIDPRFGSFGLAPKARQSPANAQRPPLRNPAGVQIKQYYHGVCAGWLILIKLP